MATCGLEITPEDFFRKIVRTNGTDFALAVKDLTAVGSWESPIDCNTQMSWKDIVMLVYNSNSEAMNVIEV
jgi:hypothetical protein